jgi:hypothetical protein
MQCPIHNKWDTRATAWGDNLAEVCHTITVGSMAVIMIGIIIIIMVIHTTTIPIILVTLIITIMTGTADIHINESNQARGWSFSWPVFLRD